MYIEGTRPIPEMVSDAWRQNSDGGGVAWREKGEIRWRKGLNEAEMQKACAELPLPMVAHFRIASVGGVRPSLTHPFPVSITGENPLNGKSKDKFVLFHNGDWRNWRDVMLTTCINKGVKLPSGKFSDTRAMAWLCSIYGVNFMEMINEKGVAMSPTETVMFTGTGWTEINGVWCSNSYFHSNVRRFKMCKHGTCTISHQLDEDGLCWTHRKKDANSPEVTGNGVGAHASLPKDGIKLGDVGVIGARQGVVVNDSATGGSQTETPFRALMLAASSGRKLSKKDRRKLKKKFGATAFQMAQEQMKDHMKRSKRNSVTH